MKVSITTKIAVALAASALAVGGILTAVTIGEINGLSKNDFSKIVSNLVIAQAVAIAQTFDAGITASTFNAADLQAVVDRNVQYHGRDFMREIRIHAADPTSQNGYRAIAGTEEVGEESDPEDIEAIRNDKIVVLPLDEDGEKVLDVTVPLHIGGKSVATAGIKLATTKIEAEQARLIAERKRQILAGFVLITGLVVLVAVGAGLLIARKITAAIKHFTFVANKLSMGELDVDPRVNSNDEVGILSDAFERMITAIKFFMNSAEEVEEAEERKVV